MVIGIIQARMGSTRLKHKMSMKLCGFALIDWIIRRCKQSKLIDKFFIATSNDIENKFLVKKAEEFKINSFVGKENNVLSRFISISEKENPSTIVRICADNPLICASEIDRIINKFLISKPDYAFNHIPKMGNNYVDGVGAEVFSIETLNKLKNRVKRVEHYEHVTKFIWDNKSEFSICTVNAPLELKYPNVRLDIDTNSDFLYVTGLIEKYSSWNFPEDINVSKVLKTI